MAKRRRPKSVAAMARHDAPFAELRQLVSALHAETVESRHLEWKSTPPFGPSVTTKIKCRIVKAVLSFANTDGGFVVFGVAPNGKWTGLDRTELDSIDPAMLVELVNSCVSPEVVGLNYTTVKRSGRWFAILHVPPSALAPHVTSKEVVEHAPDRRVLLPKGAVFCRFGAKCDLATSTQFNRIIERRTALLKAELLRRIREVEIPVVSATPLASSAAPTVLRVTAASNPSATPVRVTRDKRQATGVVVYEELDSALFDEINNVLAAGKLLSTEADFVFDQKIYHRIYAERQHVTDSHEHDRLARVAIVKFYAPMFFWVTKLSAAAIAELLKTFPFNSKSPHVRIQFPSHAYARARGECITTGDDLTFSSLYVRMNIMRAARLQDALERLAAARYVMLSRSLQQ
jgi:Schlafen, AlbA_2